MVFPVFPWFSALPVLRVSHQFCSGLSCFSALPATLLAWRRQKHSCDVKRVAQVTDDRNGKIATRGAIVPERADSESDSHVSCLNAGILKPAILSGHPRVVKCNVTGTLAVGALGKNSAGCRNFAAPIIGQSCYSFSVAAVLGKEFSDESGNTKGLEGRRLSTSD